MSQSNLHQNPARPYLGTTRHGNARPAPTLAGEPAPSLRSGQALSEANGTPALPLGLHVAIIMDGNGRWAQLRGLPRVAGHREGARAVRRIVAVAPDLGIGTLTLFAFSGDNWQRPGAEVAALMRIFGDYLSHEKDACAARGIQVSVIGRRDRLDASVLAAVECAESATAGGERMRLRIAIDYSARDAIVAAARLATRHRALAGEDPSLRSRAGTGATVGEGLTRETFSRLLADANHVRRPAPDVDLLVRSGGERRLSDCLLWEIAYAEIIFSERMWPDFTSTDLEAAIAEFHRRERRYGRIPEVAEPEERDTVSSRQ